jgi:preprotein translocase subunit YajC
MDAPTVIAASGGGSGFLFIIIIAFLLLYLIVVRPQRRRQNQQQQMLSELEVGDEVLTAGGIYGTVTRLDDDEVSVEIAPQLEVRVARRAIAAITREPEAEEGEEHGEAAEESAEGAEEAATSPEPEADSSGVIQGADVSGDESRG